MTKANLVIQSIREVTVVNFEDSSILDTLQIQTIGSALYDLVDNRNCRKLILDFSKVRFLSSSALGMLITLRKKAAAIKGELGICAMRDDLRKVFTISRLDQLFNFYKNEEEALNAFGVIGI
ncbi:MAG: STAS domain-containing protein [Phycisphaerae bacterium]